MAVLPLDAVGQGATKADEISVAFGPEEGGPGPHVVPYARPVGSQGEPDRAKTVGIYSLNGWVSK